MAVPELCQKTTTLMPKTARDREVVTSARLVSGQWAVVPTPPYLPAWLPTVEVPSKQGLPISPGVRLPPVTSVVSLVRSYTPTKPTLWL